MIWYRMLRISNLSANAHGPMDVGIRVGRLISVPDKGDHGVKDLAHRSYMPGHMLPSGNY